MELVHQMNWIDKGKLRIGVFPALGVLAPGLEVRTASRRGGVSSGCYQSLNLGAGTGDIRSNVDRNRSILLEAVGKDEGDIALGEQVHGTGLKLVSRGGLSGKTDGLVTVTRGITLVTSTADCYPVVIYEPSEKILASLHIGRRGARDGLIAKAVRLMAEISPIDTRSAIAVIGPGICGDCYTVSEEDAADFPREAKRLHKGRWHLDLLKSCRLQLAGLGFRPGLIIDSGMCTSCSPELFFSYRRDGGRTGRHWTMSSIGRAP